MEIDYFDTDVSVAIDELIRTILGYSGGIALLFLVAAGILYMTSNGNSNSQAKAKKMATYVTIGIIIILLSYSMLVVIDKIATK